MPSLTARRVVIVYFACFALGWLVLAATLLDGEGSRLAEQPLRATRDPAAVAWRMLLLAAHAAAVAVLAWKAQRWFFAHGLLAVVCAGAPLVVLLREVWLVPVFLYVIALLHVGQAARHESRGHLQAPPRPSVHSRLC